MVACCGSMLVVVVHCGLLWLWLAVTCCGSLWLVEVRCGSLWLVVARCGSLWLVVARCGSLWPEACNFIKKETLAQVFSCEFCQVSKNTFYTEHLCTTTSIQIVCQVSRDD